MPLHYGFRAGARRDDLIDIVRANSVAREHFRNFPSMPFLRNDCAYEELTFIPSLLRHYRPQDFDVTLTCNYPFTNWLLRRPAFGGSRPPHIFVTENGDWPAFSNQSEYRFFDCDGSCMHKSRFL